MATRMPRQFLASFLLSAGFWSMASPAAARGAGEERNVVESWVRPPGDAEAVEAPGLARLKVDLGSLELTDVARFDAQYRKDLYFQGVSLAAFIQRLAPPASVDLALLHFANGMVVPLPFRDRAVMDRLKPFVALRMHVSRSAPASSDFPPLTRKVREYVDVPGTHFAGNKMVVAELWHPAVSEGADSTFSPWAQVDSLVAVEFVQASPYYKQFDVDRSPDVGAGLALFRGSCQFCHGARKVGAKFGWDFVEPVPLYTYRKGERRLYYHVHYRRLDAAERGQNMPALKFMTETDAGQLWQWLKAVGTKPMAPYAPRP